MVRNILKKMDSGLKNNDVGGDTVMKPVTDPSLISKLEARPAWKPITDPDLITQLEGKTPEVFSPPPPDTQAGNVVPTPEEEALQTPWVDPISAFTGGFTGTLKSAIGAGVKVLPAVGRAALSGLTSAVTDYPIGQATEAMEKKADWLALPFSVLVGTLSGATLESAIQKKVISAFSKRGINPTEEMLSKVSDQVKETLSQGKHEEADGMLEDITRLAQNAIVPSIPVKTKAQRQATAPITELAGEALTPPKKGWQRTADDLLQKRVEGGVMNTPINVVNPTRPSPQGDNLKKPNIEEAVPSIPRPAGNIAAGSLAYGMELPKKAINVNLDRVGANYPVKKLILDTSDMYSQAINQAKQGKFTFAETVERANELKDMIDSKLSVQGLIKDIKSRTDNLDAYITASRDILNTSAQQVEAIRKAAIESGSDEALARFRMALNRHAWVQAEIGGASSKIGRALSVHRITSQPTANYKAILNALGGREVTEEMLNRLSKIDPGDSLAVNRFIRDATQAKTSDKIFEAWINSLLSGPVTHVVNTTSNTLTFLSKLPERTMSAGIEAIRSKMTGRSRERFFSEVPATVFGAWQGIKEGVRKAVWAYQNELSTEGVSKIEVAHPQAIKGKLGRFIRIPGRALTAEDEFFKAVNYQAELHSLALRQAIFESKKWDEIPTRVAEILSNPSGTLKEKTTGEMLYRVFQSESKTANWLVSGRKLPYVGQVYKYIVPFVRTPLNIAKFGLERTPLNYPFIMKKMFKGEISGGEVSDELAKATMGSLIGAATLMYAREGTITGGGPKDKAERDALYRTGWQPYSIKIGDTYYSYGRLEPLGMIAGLAADASEIWDKMTGEEQENVAALIITSITKNLLNKTFMKGLSDAFNAVSDPARYGENWIQSFAGTVVPSGVATVARATDPTIRETQDLLESIKTRIPVASTTVLPKRSIWGEPVKRGGSTATRLLSPVAVSEERGNKIDREILRLGISIDRPRKTFMVRGQEVELTPDQYDQFIQEAGQKARERLSRIIEFPAYSRLSDEAKGKLIKSVYSNIMQEQKPIYMSEGGSK